MQNFDKGGNLLMQELTKISFTSTSLKELQIAIDQNFDAVEQQISSISGVVIVNTTEYWDQQITFVPQRGDIIVYSDHSTTIIEGQTVDVPGIKIGDGNAYVVDLPFIDDTLRSLIMDHINNREVHIQDGEREFWDNKLNLEISGEILTFNRN